MHWIKSRLPPLLRGVLEVSQRLGASVTPNHFYSEIPDVRSLRAQTLWREPFSMVGVRGADPDAQLRFAREVCSPFSRDLAAHPEGDPAGVYARAIRSNGEIGYGPTEAEFLYCFVRRFKPRRVVQVGCGVSTALVLLAAGDEPGYAPELTCVEPFPTEFLRREASAGRITLRHEPAQATPPEVFAALADGDLLFVDSTHTVKPGSEVPRLMLEAMPRLAPGVFVHFHDIFFPYDYPPDALGSQIFFWRESLLLHAFLAMNPGFELCASLSMLHHARAGALRELLPNYRPAPMSGGLFAGPGHFPSSTFLRRAPG